MPPTPEAGHPVGDRPAFTPKVCSDCGKTGHVVDDCYLLHPEKHPPCLSAPAALSSSPAAVAGKKTLGTGLVAMSPTPLPDIPEAAEGSDLLFHGMV